MRIALINENSQGAKNGMIYNSLKKVADQYGFEVDNYGMYTAEDGDIVVALIDDGADRKSVV